MRKVSIVIPTHNRAQMLPRAVRSAREAAPDPQIIVVDDASSDSTAKICRTLGDVDYVRLDRNVGLAGARNAGIDRSCCPYVAFLDDDDVCLPGSVESQVSFLERNVEHGMVYGPVLYADANLIPTGRSFPDHLHQGDVFWQMLKGNFISCIGVTVRKSCFGRVGCFDSSLRSLEDWDMWLRVAEHYPVGAVDRPIGIYRLPSVASGQLSSNGSKMAMLSARVQARGLNLPRARGAPASVRRDLRRRHLDQLSDSLIFGAAEAVAAGLMAGAQTRLWTALRLNWLRAARPWTIYLLWKSYASPCQK